MSGFGEVTCWVCGGAGPTHCDGCAARRVWEATAELHDHRDRLAAEVKRLEAEAGALRRALSTLVRKVEDSGLHLVSCIFDPAMEEARAAIAAWDRAVAGEGGAKEQ